MMRNLGLAGAGLVACMAAASPAAIIKTSDGGGADARVTENVTGVGPTGAVSGGAGTGTATIDIRSNGNLTGNRDKNEIGLLRFDLSSSLLGGARADIDDAELKMVYQRTGPQTGSFDIYGVLPETAGENDWAENAISFNSAPGITFDGDTSTRGIDAAATVFLGSVAFANQTKPSSAAEVANDSGVITFGDNEDNTALINFLKQADSDDLVSFIITVTTEGNTQFRLASKELTSLEGGAPVGSAGDFASRLVVTVPEPASLGLLAAGGLALLARRRRGV